MTLLEGHKGLTMQNQSRTSATTHFFSTAARGTIITVAVLVNPGPCDAKRKMQISKASFRGNLYQFSLSIETCVSNSSYVKKMFGR